MDDKQYKDIFAYVQLEGNRIDKLYWEIDSLKIICRDLQESVSAIQNELDKLRDYDD